MNPQLLVVAKAPVAGEAKTRLGARVGPQLAAELAAASLLDTLRACADAVGVANCHASMTGDLSAAARGDDVRRALEGWTVREQRGPDFGTRLVNAHLDLPAGQPVIQVGMDTPQVDAGLLLEVADLLAEHDAVLGPAPDGGWWVLGLRDPGRAACLRGVPMSTPTTGADTRQALVDDGLDVATATELTDVDTLEDAESVAAEFPKTEFARLWSSR